MIRETSPLMLIPKGVLNELSSEHTINDEHKKMGLVISYYILYIRSVNQMNLAHDRAIKIHICILKNKKKI